MAGKEIKLEDTISEILVADSDWESDAEASDVDYFEEEVEQQKQQLQASANSNHRLQQGAYYQPGDSLKKGTQISILLSVQQKVDHETLASEIINPNAPPSVCFSQPKKGHSV